MSSAATRHQVHLTITVGYCHYIISICIWQGSCRRSYKWTHHNEWIIGFILNFQPKLLRIVQQHITIFALPCEILRGSFPASKLTENFNMEYDLQQRPCYVMNLPLYFLWCKTRRHGTVWLCSCWGAPHSPLGRYYRTLAPWMWWLPTRCLSGHPPGHQSRPPCQCEELCATRCHMPD